MKFISKLFLYVFVAIIAYLIFLPALMPLGLTPFTKEYHEGYNDYFRGYSSKYNATRGNSFSFNIESFRNEAYCAGYEDAWSLSDLEKNEHGGKVLNS
jgi:hypothetical protein